MFDPKHDRDTLDYYAMQFDDRGNPSPAKFKTPQPKKPVISHEAGNYLTFSRPDLIDQFRDNIKPYWLTASQAKLEQLGLTQEAKQWALNSERLYALCHKINLESLRLNPYLSGYHWWLFQDYWTTSNGLVDHYFRPKSITKEEVLNINNDVVLLQQGLDVTYRGKSPLKMKLLVSNFSPGSLQGKLTCEVKVSEQLLVAPKPSVKAVPQGEVAEAGQIALELPDTNAPAKLCIKVELAAGEERYTNDWTSWLYPATIKPAALPIPVFADKTQIERFPDWGLRLIPAEGRSVIAGCTCRVGLPTAGWWMPWSRAPASCSSIARTAA